MKTTQNIFFLSLLLALSACTGSRYNVMSSVGDEETMVNSVLLEAPSIQPGQELCIAVSALNEESVAYFRTSRWREGATGIECLYYQVNQEGDITLPLIGDVTVAGFTLEEVEVQLSTVLSELLREPKVRVRHVDYEVNVLGEVEIPGNYQFEDGRVTLLEAIAKAGGITQYGKRKNVLLIRDTPDGIKHVRIDLTSNELWDTEYYYLHHGDVVMIDSNPARVANSHNVTTYGSVLVGLGTILAIFATQ